MNFDKILIDKPTYEEKMDKLINAVLGIATNNGTSEMTFGRIQAIVAAGLAPEYFEIGDQIIVNKMSSMVVSTNNARFSATINKQEFLEGIGEAASKDYIFTYTGTAYVNEKGQGVNLADLGITVTGSPIANDYITVHEVASQLVYDIIGFDKETPIDPTKLHSMTLQLHGIFTNLMFDEKEFALASEEVLPAGKYKFTNSGTAYAFTTTKDIPIGGGIRWSADTFSASVTVTTYEADTRTVLEEGLVLSSDVSGATDLGALNTKSNPFANSSQRHQYGSNNYLNSAIKQFINAKQTAGNWWSKKTIFDRKPAAADTLDGFLYGVDPSFLAVCGKVKKTWKSDTVWDNSGEHIIEDKFFLLSNAEVMFNSASDEGTGYPYYSDEIPSKSDSAQDIRKKMSTSGSYGYWWLRTAYRGYAYYAYYVNTPGANVGNYAINAVGVAPACVIM